MPLIHVELIEGIIDEAQKQEIIRRLTDAVASIEGDSLRPVTRVVIEEIASGER